MKKPLGWTLSLAIFAIAGLAFLAAILMPVFASAKLAAQRTACFSKIKELSQGTELYRADFDDRLMTASRWTDQISPYQEEPAYSCIEGQGVRYSYAFNRSLSDRQASEIASPEQTPLFFDSKIMFPNVAGGLELLPFPPRHAGANSIVYVNGRIRPARTSQEESRP